jgi:DNA-binding transcriptional regulator YhcF (GntR family)
LYSLGNLLRRTEPALGAWLRIDKASDQPLAEQIYGAIHEQIVHGRLRSGYRLPSTRALSLALGISRSTVAVAFERLIADGFVEGHVGSGTYVSRRAIVNSLRAERARGAAQRGHEPMRHTEETAPAFALGPTIEYFPFDVWQSLAAEQVRSMRRFSSTGDPAGYQPLRIAIADFSRRQRGIVCSPSQVIVTMGATQALDLVARTVAKPGDAALIEDPSDPRVWQTFANARVKPIAVPVDDEGANVDAVDPAAWLEESPRVLSLTPVRQYPLGVSLSPTREKLLLRRMSQWNAWTVELDGTFTVRPPRDPIIANRGGQTPRPTHRRLASVGRPPIAELSRRLVRPEGGDARRKRGKRRNPAPRGGGRIQPDFEALHPESPPCDVGVEFEQAPGGRRLAGRGASLRQRLQGNVWNSVDEGQAVPMDMAGEAQHRRLRLAQRRMNALDAGIGGDAEVALEIVIADVRLAGERNMRGDDERLVRGRDRRAKPGKVGVVEMELRAAGQPPDPGVRPPENQAPGAEVDDLMAQRLAEQRLVVGDFEEIAIVVAAEVKARRGDVSERLGDLALQHEVGGAVAIGNAIAEIDHDVRPHVGDETAEFRHQPERGRTLLGVDVFAVVNVRDDRNLDLRHALSARFVSGAGSMPPPAP